MIRFVFEQSCSSCSVENKVMQVEKANKHFAKNIRRDQGERVPA